MMHVVFHLPLKNVIADGKFGEEMMLVINFFIHLNTEIKVFEKVSLLLAK